MNMKFCEVMAYYDYKMINIVRALHVARDTVKAWKAKDEIPFSKQCEIEVLTKGKLKASKMESIDD
jgi:DNA-binding transcriptional regulator Cro